MSLLDMIVLLETNEKGRCSSCGREFDLLEEFGSDSKALNEYTLSQLCNSCQKELFNIGDIE